MAASIAHADTEYSADCIEFCPHVGYEDIFLCGTYQVLEPSTVPPESRGADDDDDEEIGENSRPRQTQRTGRILLFQVSENETTFEEIQRIETAAILDAKWSPRLEDDRPVIAVADAKGCVTRYALTPEKHLEELERIAVVDEEILCLSLDYSPHDQVLPSIITSLSSGSLAFLQHTPSGYEPTSTWKAHDYEPWIASFDRWDPNRVWSGGDDCVLKSWDLRMTGVATARNKGFEAGVTTIASSPHEEHLLAVGSYDANLRIFDSRNISSPLSTIACAGGIWRTKFHPDPKRKGDILLACMHGGFSVVRLSMPSLRFVVHGGGSECGAELVKRFEGHSSLAYGADWCRLRPLDGTSLVASCSFYDHALHMWRA